MNAGQKWEMREIEGDSKMPIIYRKPKPVAILTDFELIDEYSLFKEKIEQFGFKKGHHYYQYENPKARWIVLRDEIKRMHACKVS